MYFQEVIIHCSIALLLYGINGFKFIDIKKYIGNRWIIKTYAIFFVMLKS